MGRSNMEGPDVLAIILANKDHCSDGCLPSSAARTNPSALTVPPPCLAVYALV
jgi:hypothetical protein